jgi:hypothetical protein
MAAFTGLEKSATAQTIKTSVDQTGIPSGNIELSQCPDLWCAVLK